MGAGFSDLFALLGVWLGGKRANSGDVSAADTPLHTVSAALSLVATVSATTSALHSVTATDEVMT